MSRSPYGVKPYANLKDMLTRLPALPYRNLAASYSGAGKPKRRRASNPGAHPEHRHRSTRRSRIRRPRPKDRRAPVLSSWVRSVRARAAMLKFFIAAPPASTPMTSGVSPRPSRATTRQEGRHRHVNRSPSHRGFSPRSSWNQAGRKSNLSKLTVVEKVPSE